MAVSRGAVAPGEVAGFGSNADTLTDTLQYPLGGTSGNGGDQGQAANGIRLAQQHDNQDAYVSMLEL